MTDNQKAELEYVRKYLTSQIAASVMHAERVKEKLTPDVVITLIHLKTFSAYMNEKNIENMSEAMELMNEVKGVPEKVAYIGNFLRRMTEPAVNP